MRSVLPFVLLLAGCPKDPSPSKPDADFSRCSPVIGDLTQPPEADVVVQLPDGGGVRVVTDGDQVPIFEPPQGGEIIAASVRVKNFDGCVVELTGALIDPCNHKVAGFEGRPVEMLVGADGWGMPSNPLDLTDFANVAVCPSTSTRQDVAGAPWILEVKAKDQQGRSVAKQVQVTPTCSEPANLATCECECSAGYKLGQTCDPKPDAGPTDCPVDAGP